MASTNEAVEENRESARATDKDAVAVYDLKDLSGPRVSGIVARILASAINSKLLGPTLRRKVLSDSGFTSFHARTEISTDTLRYPLNYPLPASPSDPLHFEQVDNFIQSVWEKTTKPANKRCSVRDYAEAYRSGNVSPIHVCEAILRLIQESDLGNRPLNAVTSINTDAVRRDAAASAERWRAGCPISVLDGVPFFVKDMIFVRDALHGTTGGIGHLVRSPPPADPRDADIVAALRKAGMLMIGKTQTEEIGMGVRGFNQHMGQTRNPWNLDRVPGGSSGGSAAAVAAGLAPIALGSDGGGSIRIPAACCGIFGIKPTFARLSINGRFFQTDSEDDVSDGKSTAPSKLPTTSCFGPIALCADDLALAYFVLAAHAPHGPIRDEPAFVGQLREPLPAKLDPGVAGMTVGVYDAWVEHTSAAGRMHFRRAVEKLEAAGAVVRNVVVPDLEDIRCAHGIAITGGAYRELEENGALDEGKWSQMGIDTRMKMLLASEFDDGYMERARSVRARAVKQTVPKLFTEVDVLLTPALGGDVPEVPHNLATGVMDAGADSRLIRFMTFANLTGVPAITVPVGVDEGSGMPYSVQVIAGPWQEVVLLQTAKFLENCLSPTSACPPVAFDVLQEAAKISTQEGGGED